MDELRDPVADAIARVRPGGGVRVAHIGGDDDAAALTLAARGARVTVVDPVPAAAGGLAGGGFDLVHVAPGAPVAAEHAIPLVRAVAAAAAPGGDVVVRWPVDEDGPSLDSLFEAFVERAALEVDEVEMADGPRGPVALVVAHIRADEESRAPRAFPQQVGLLEVVDAFALTPAMRRVVFTGPALSDLRVDEPGEIVTLIWPAAGTPVVLPERGRWRFPPGAPEQHVRNYSVRHVDRAARRLTVDFFLHDDPGHAGDWAAAARPGQVIGFGGTRTHWTTDPLARWSLLVADETGLPALAAIAESRPAGHRTIAVVEVRDAREDAALPAGRDIEMNRLLRGPRPAGVPGGIVAALAALDLPQGRGQVWVAAETHLVSAVRAHLLGERGVPRDALSAVGYWHRDHD